MRTWRGFMLFIVGGTLLAFAYLATHHNEVLVSSMDSTLSMAPATQMNSGQSGYLVKPDLVETARLSNVRLNDYIAGALPSPVQDNQTEPFAPFYKHIDCLAEKSNRSCSFPLLTDRFKRCGYFPETTEWTDPNRGYPKATMEAAICKVPSVTSGARKLRRYVTQRNISGIVLVGDSHAARSNKALIELFENATFKCKRIKHERSIRNISLDYYTKGTGFKTNATAGRVCHTCNSELHVCTDNEGHKVRVEYISMDMGSRVPIHLTGAECRQNPDHPLCSNLTQQEYVFRHYLKQNKVYPELFLIFSIFVHTVYTPLHQAFDAIRDKFQLITDTVPASSDIIWYGSTPYNIMQLRREPKTPEGLGLPVNNKMQILNHFLATVLANHFAAERRPVFTFFDMYHMQARMKEAWKFDNNHFQPVWYQYVVSYTAAMLNSLPLHQKQ